MLAKDEVPLPAGEVGEKAQRAEVAVGDPDIAGLDNPGDLDELGSFRGGAVRDQEGVAGQHPPRVEYDQRPTRQRGGPGRPRFLEAVLGGPR